MIDFVMTVGVPASGKSTWAEKRALEGDYIWLSSDLIRENHGYMISNQEVFKLMWEYTVESLLKGQNVIYDATNLSARRRRGLIERIKALPLQDIVLFRCEVFVQPYEILQERNALREGRAKVPEDVIKTMISRFQFPQYFEGWDYIHINANSTGKKVSVNAMKGFDQKTSYHNLDLYEHTLAGIQFARVLSLSNTVEEALWHHDIGKMYCQTFDENGLAHYYGHENISAYMFCLLAVAGQENYSNEDFFEIIFLINYHMRPYNWTQKSFNKDAEVFGIDFISKLKLMHKCDCMAH